MTVPKLNLDPDHISDFLNEPNIESNSPSVTQLMPPLPCRMTVTLDEVIAYDRNPRRSKNPNYESIKESILNRGLDDEPTITRRSIDEPFMIRCGGNTRLEILRELYKEHQELAKTAEDAGNLDEAKQLRIKSEEFYRFEWGYKPWEGETNALIGHMAENEERGDMIYIEKALAVKELQDIFSEDDNNILSSRKLAVKITESGWSIGHTSITLMLYTINELHKKIDRALWAGLGSAQISKLRALHRAYTKFCQTQNISAEIFNKIWHEVLTICDDEELNIESIRRYADQLISDEIDVEYFTVTAEIDAILSGNKPVIRDMPLSQQQQNTQNQTENTDNEINLPSTDSTTINGHNSPASSDSSENATTIAPQTTSNLVTLEQINELRQQIYVDVVTLGLPFELAHYVNKTQTGLGFFIEPVKEAEYETQADIQNSPEHLNRNAVWLYLKQLSLHNLFLSQGEMVPVEQAVSGSELTPDVFFTLNSHFHLMRMLEKNIQNGVDKIEKSIHSLLQAADIKYGKNAIYQLFDNL